MCVSCVCGGTATAGLGDAARGGTHNAVGDVVGGHALDALVHANVEGLARHRLIRRNLPTLEQLLRLLVDAAIILVDVGGVGVGADLERLEGLGEGQQCAHRRDAPVPLLRIDL
jgi:hypothetical protein